MQSATSEDRASPRRKAGRPPLSGGSEQIAIRLPTHIMESVEHIVAERGHVTERSTVIRELIAEALAARAKGKK